MVNSGRRALILNRSAVLLICLVGCLLGGRLVFAQPYALITLHFSERPPYQYADSDGRAAGLLIGLTANTFANAGIPVKWKLQPFNRSLKVIKSNNGNDCSIGWFKTPEREVYAQFTLPIDRDRPQVGVVRADFSVVPGVTAKEMLADPETRLLLKQSFAYGEYLDGLIGKMPVENVQRVSVEIPNLLRMLQARRADVLILSIEEVEFYAMQSERLMQDFRVVSFADVPQGELRYLMCSKQIPAAMIDRLNEAIRTEINLGDTAAENID